MAYGFSLGRMKYRLFYDLLSGKLQLFSISFFNDIIHDFIEMGQVDIPYHETRDNVTFSNLLSICILFAVVKSLGGGGE